ncbi:MAG: chorismate synthase, partial [Methanoregulaceae archaeon]|nr:chorismate synthase [Methanoregulaceae archaeon]
MNTFGRNFRCTSFGESHGPALGVIIDGCPSAIALSEADIQPLLDRRRPGASPLTSPRQEPDTVRILSGVFEGRTTGAPIALIIGNRDTEPAEYDRIRDCFRPGHADFTYMEKFGIRDHRGGGRSSGRETVARVAAGGIAVKCLSLCGISLHGKITEIGGERDPGKFASMILSAREREDSVGGIVEIRAQGVPPGLGDPVFGKLDALIASAMMGIGAVKGVEIGDGFALARLTGSLANDQMSSGGFLSNHAGGILGGISNGNEIVVRIAVKPTPSIARDQATVDIHGKDCTISIRGRHDPCIAPRIVPVAEAMLALVLL